MADFSFPNPVPIYPDIPGLTFPIGKKPHFKTLEFRAVSGRRVTSPQMILPLWEYDLVYDFLRDQTQNQTPWQQYAGKQELLKISELFLTCNGKYGQFYFDDLSDNSRYGQALGVGDGVTTVFVAYRNWGYGAFITTEPVGGINTLETVYYNGVPVPSNQYSFSGNVITFNPAPPNGQAITIDFHFYYLCQFLDDEHDYSQFMHNLWQFQSCKLMSIHP